MVIECASLASARRAGEQRPLSENENHSLTPVQRCESSVSVRGRCKTGAWVVTTAFDGVCHVPRLSRAAIGRHDKKVFPTTMKFFTGMRPA
jgi:hypothetical protein